MLNMNVQINLMLKEQKEAWLRFTQLQTSKCKNTMFSHTNPIHILTFACDDATGASPVLGVLSS